MSLANMHNFPVCQTPLPPSVVRVPGYRPRGPGLDSRRYQILWVVGGLQQGLISLLSTIEELIGRNSTRSCSSLEDREYGRGDPLR
jgi:hypothetical protein